MPQLLHVIRAESQFRRARYPFARHFHAKHGVPGFLASRNSISIMMATCECGPAAFCRGESAASRALGWV